jgi:Polyketide cyclase / dehydrase and lipid transport
VTSALTTSVEYVVPVDVAFAYLADPRNRPEWQSSLRGVDMLDEDGPRVGTRWRDLTAARIEPEMVITELETGVLWAETGRWRAFEADLTLGFSAAEEGCTVTAAFAVRGRGLLRPVGWAATRAGVLAVRGDLRKAARILASRRS